jgi:hypothetical protein
VKVGSDHRVCIFAVSKIGNAASILADSDQPEEFFPHKTTARGLLAAKGSATSSPWKNLGLPQEKLRSQNGLRFAS